MKTQITKLLAAVCLFLNSGAMAQQILPGTEGMYPSFIKYKEHQPVFNRHRIEVTDVNGKNFATKDVKLQREDKDEQGITHYRYQQEFNGIPVEHAMWVVHSREGKIISQNGKLVKSFPANLAAKATLESRDALKKALESVNAKKYKWEIEAEEEFLKKEQGNASATFYPKETLVYYSGESEVNPALLRLAYKFDIYAQEPLSRKYVFVDALNGKILGERELIHETNANGTAITVYSGTQNIRTDYTGTNYRLRETARGTGNGVINTYNLLQGTNYGAAVDFTDADNTWNNVNAQKDQYATDAHWGTEMTYDYYLITHNRNSIDGLGFPLNSYVHYDINYFNAFWDGTRMTYGDGNATDNFKPLTSLDVCGHEITHGVTSYTSNLVYAYESGAMNEGFSDIFGTAIEAYARPGNYDWLIGADFFTIRSMSDPNAYSDPDTYVGTNWYSGPGDNGGVHTNSGVLNHWFYLLTTGGSGTDDHGVAYNVSGIGMSSAARIAYRLNTHYLVSTSTYADARTFGIQAAEDIFGSPSNEATQTANSWSAVGLYAPTCASAANLSSSGFTETTADVTWDAIPGAVYYIVDYKAAASSTWLPAGSSATNSKTITGLTATTLYDWRVKSSCSGSYSQAQFTTGAPECNPPLDLAVSVAGTTVFLEWSPPSYAVSFHVRYKPAADFVWIDAGWVSGLTHTLSGLLNNTLYDWKVETDCSFDTSGAAYSTFLTDAPSCGAPTGLTVGYTAGLTTTLSWTEAPGAINYRVQLKWPWAGWGGGEMIDTTLTNDSLVFVGFMSGMTLDWRVRSICSTNQSVNAYSTLTTPCPGPSGLTAGSITGNSAVLSWTSGGANSPFGYDVDYKLATSGTWIHSAYVGPTTHTLTGLTQGKLYDARVRQECQVTNSSYIQTQFTTLCSSVPAPAATEVKTNGAKITWTALSGAVSYTLQYKKSTVGVWTTVSGITANFYTVTGLTASTIYNFQVSASCTYGSSAYSAVGSFTTYCVSSANNGQEWIDYFSLGGITRTSGADAGGYIHTGLTGNLLIGSTGNAGIISAGFSGGTKTEIFAVYIDLNKNGVYTETGERVTGPTTFSIAGNVNFTVSIPAGTAAGVTSMRVVMLRNGATMGSCVTGGSNKGETEDYFINLTTARSEEPEQLNASGASYHIYPNPSEGVFRVECSNCNGISSYEIMNVSGSVIEKNDVNAHSELMIDISDRATGIYFLRLTDPDGNMQVLKLAKN